MRNYNKNYNKKREEVAKPVEVVEEPVVEETIVEAESVVEETIVEAEPVVEEKIVTPKMGVVTECLQLNVRKTPSADAEVVAIIDLATEVLIDESESTDDFYKITTATSVEGFCMKQFIAV